MKLNQADLEHIQNILVLLNKAKYPDMDMKEIAEAFQEYSWLHNLYTKLKEEGETSPLPKKVEEPIKQVEQPKKRRGRPIGSRNKVK